MHHSTGKKIAALTLILFVLSSEARNQEQQKMDPEKQKEEVIRILKAEGLWGKAMPAMLARLPSWATTEVKQDSVAVFPNMVVGTRPLKSNEAKADLKELENAMRLKPGKPRPESQQFLQNHLGAAQPPFHAEIHTSRDDHKPRLAWVGTDVQFLKVGLSLAVVQEQLGKPKKVTRQIIQTDGDRRPVTLTLHDYAGGAVAFAESDLNPKPGLVDRVILDVAAVKAALFNSE